MAKGAMSFSSLQGFRSEQSHMEENQKSGAQRAQQLWVLSTSEMLILKAKFMSAYRMPGSGGAGTDKFLFSRVWLSLSF